MANPTYLVITTVDAQGYEELVKIQIKPGSFDGTVLPTLAKQLAVIEAMFGTDKLSTSIVKDFHVEVHCDPVVDVPIGGTGIAATATYIKTRNDITNTDFVLSIPGANKADLLFDPSNPNAVSTSDPLFSALRTALVDAAIAWSDPKPISYAALTSAQTLQAASVLQGKRAPKRVR